MQTDESIAHIGKALHEETACYDMSIDRCAGCYMYLGDNTTRQLCVKTRCNNVEKAYYHDMLLSAKRTWEHYNKGMKSRNTFR